MFAAILQEAWRQYRRRPLAVALSLALGLAQLPLTLVSLSVQRVAIVPILVLNLLLELFLIAYLAGAVGREAQPASAALSAATRSFAPGIRAYLLKVVYALPAFLIGVLLLSPGDTATLSSSQRATFVIGLAPLFGFAWAFLAVLPQRVVLDNERKVLKGASVAHRVAAAHFPICLAISLVEAASLVVSGLPTGVAAAAMVVLSLVEPFRIAMGNSLFLRTRELHTAEPRARSGDQGRW